MGVIIHTTDTGATWQNQNSNVDQELNWIKFKDPLTGWCVGSGEAHPLDHGWGKHWNSGNTRDDSLAVELRLL